MQDERIVDKIYSALIHDGELMKLIGNPTTATARNAKIVRARMESNEQFKPPIIGLFLDGATPSNNSYRLRAKLDIEIYANNRSEGVRIKDKIRRIMFKLGYLRDSGGQKYCKCYCWRDTYKVLVNADS